MTDHRDDVEELLADYRRSRDELASVQRTLLSISESASSPDGLLTATVGGRGTLTKLVIDDAAYQRHSPAELAELVVRTVSAATTKVAGRAADVLAPVLPAGADPAALLAGTADLSPAEYEPEPPALATTPARGRHATHDELDEDSFEEMSWMNGADQGGSS
ncbi:MAG TPA: YbaB/EbfC family nucleoid-associated protein [Pseudonocardiaceae bacterium]|nr:YbaB/EbfC family nucleoid-associated protein [Pseudonocardiaceae bacterium]